MTEEQLAQIHAAILKPFYWLPEFWIGLFVGLVSVVFSYKAYREAMAAKKAAREAGQSVKIQTVTIELSEITQKLERLQLGWSFGEARDLLTEVSRRLHRQIAPLGNLNEIKTPWENLKVGLAGAREALEGVRPQGGNESSISPSAVYFAMQTHFSNISDMVAEIMGLCEKRTIEAKTDE